MFTSINILHYIVNHNKNSSLSFRVIRFFQPKVSCRYQFCRRWFEDKSAWYKHTHTHTPTHTQRFAWSIHWNDCNVHFCLRSCVCYITSMFAFHKVSFCVIEFSLFTLCPLVQNPSLCSIRYPSISISPLSSY